MSVLTVADMEYLESYNHMEMNNYSFCNITTIAKDIVVDDEINKLNLLVITGCVQIMPVFTDHQV
jgi:hypothetical protein